LILNVDSVMCWSSRVVPTLKVVGELKVAEELEKKLELYIKQAQEDCVHSSWGCSTQWENKGI